jgi:hypothetical protein
MMKNLTSQYHFVVLGIFLAAAAYFRIWAAPLSAGPDVAQFWGFATVFHTHVFDFYRYADGTLPIYPFKGWDYFYPPIWLIILGLCLLAVPDTEATGLMVDPSWRLVMKTPIIAADLVIGCLIFWTVPGRKWIRLLFAGLWLFHPTAWFESAVFGQFDATASAFLLASIITLEWGSKLWAFILAGLAVMTKQHTFLAVGLVVVTLVRNIGWKPALKYIGIFCGLAIIISLPFLITGNFIDYFRSIIVSTSAPVYQYPIMYAFNGIGSSLTYIHDTWGWDTEGVFRFCIPTLVITWLIAGILVYKRNITPLRAALIGICLFVAIFYRINYQYLVIYIPLALMVAARTDHWSERIVSLLLALTPLAWLWISDPAYWFTYLDPKYYEAFLNLKKVGLAHWGTPDYAYVILASGIMVLCLVYVIGAFLWWRQPLRGEPSSKLMTV